MYSSYSSYYSRDQSLGQRSLGKAQIQCSLLKSRTRWGTIGQATPPSPHKAGLLYFQMNFIQPDTYSLRHVTVSMEFCTPTDPGCGPFVQKHAPERMFGQAQERNNAKGKELSPEIDVGGIVGVKLGGVHSSSEYTSEERWSFTGHRQAVNQQDYTQVLWKLEDPQAQGRSTERPITTAAVLLLEGDPAPKPFVVKVNIDGKLKSKLHKWRIFDIRSRTIQSTEITPGTSASDISNFVDGLAAAIEEENLLHATTGKTQYDHPRVYTEC